MIRPTKNQYFLRMAALAATRAHDPSTKVGSVIIHPETGSILSTGYNGLPFGVENRPERYADRTIKLRHTSHAEANAICLAARNGTKLDGAHIYVTATPCCDCARHIIQAGIRRVFIPSVCPFGNPPDMKESFDATFAMFNEAGVEVHRVEDVGTEVFARGEYKRI